MPSFLGGARAKADIVLDISGSLGADYGGGDSGLASGSFKVAVDIESFPPANANASYSVGSYAVSIYHASGALVESFSSPDGAEGS